MTECERIFESGLVKKEFLKEEYLENFFVTTRQKKIWLIELDLLRVIHEICERHGIRYVLAAGSLLGAIRHGGFIPWDDDIDIEMPRTDYDRFINLKDEFKDPYFLQIPCEDDGYYYSMARVRNSRTSAIDYPFLFQDFNQGIFIDVHPYDKSNSVSSEDAYNEVDRLVRKNSLTMRVNHPRLSERDKLRINDYQAENPIDVYQRINEIIRSQAGRNCDSVSYFTATAYGFKRNTFNKEWFDERIEITFQGQKTYIPSEYNKILRVEYENNIDLPPENERKISHGTIYFDPDRPYSDIIPVIRREVIDGKCNIWNVV